MHSTESSLDLALSSDIELVAACLSGDRAAYAPIVERYQRLLCSLAYSATGQLSQSEDLAQETFVEAWHQLPKLREPEKLRSWLCGILRHKISRLRRADGREPSRQAESLDAVAELENDDLPAADIAVQNEEQAIMWSALERVPETYREPLILYYREHRSVEHVAVALDLSEDAVKQRLMRGRKILQEQVLSFVEGALARSTPGRVFTAAVLASIPALTATPAKAAGVGAAAAQGSMLVKSTVLAALVASLSGVISAVISLRTNLEQARTAPERRAVVKITAGIFFGVCAYLGVLYGLREAAFRPDANVWAWAMATQVLVVGFVLIAPIGLSQIMRYMRRLRTAERQRSPESFRDARDQMGSAANEYRSAWTLFGVPLIHIRYGWPDEGEPPVFGWIAGGDRAYGLLMAWGGFAVAPISVGVVSCGILSVGSLSLGFIALGTISLGKIALGCAAVGVNTFAWLSAMGWQSAAGGGFALARYVAVGPLAFAPHANDQTAIELLAQPNGDQNQLLFFAIISILTLVPVTCYAIAVRKRLGRRATDTTSPTNGE